MSKTSDKRSYPEGDFKTAHSSKKQNMARDQLRGAGVPVVAPPDGSCDVNDFNVMCRIESLRAMRLIRLQQQRRILGMPDMASQETYSQPLYSHHGVSSAANNEVAFMVHQRNEARMPLARPMFPNEINQHTGRPDQLESYLQYQVVKRMAAQQKLAQERRSNRDAMIRNLCRPDNRDSLYLPSTVHPNHCNEEHFGAYSNYPQGQVHDSMFIERRVCESSFQPTASTTLMGVTELPALMSRDMDLYVLSPLQAFMREQIQVFAATPEDGMLPIRGRNKRIHQGQVGIRCRHCQHLPRMQRQKGTLYFPATLVGLYQAAQNMNINHLQCGLCVAMPDEIKQTFVALLSGKGKANSGAGRVYWAESAKQFGLVNTTLGLFRMDRIPSTATVLVESEPTTGRTRYKADQKAVIGTPDSGEF